MGKTGEGKGAARSLCGAGVTGLPGQGQGRGARKRCALAVSEATAFAFKAEISLSEPSQQLQLGP